MSKACLVTGAGGFIGCRLAQPGDRLLLRKPIGLADEAIGDLLDPVSLALACRDIETVFHCAGYAHSDSHNDADLHWRINFEGTRNLLTAAARSGVKCFVFMSSVKALADPGNECVGENWPGEPSTPYGKAKRAAEEIVLEAGTRYGMHVVILRLAMVYGRGGRGNLQRMANGIRTGWFPPLPETRNKRSLVHVSDVVAAARLVASRPDANGRIYIVSHREPYSGREIQDAIRCVLKQPALAWHVPAALLRAGGNFGDWLETVLGRSMILNSEKIARLLDSECYSPQRIEQELGWRAKIGLIPGLQEMLDDEAPV